MDDIRATGFYSMHNIDSCLHKPSGNNVYNNVLVVINMGFQRGAQIFFCANKQESYIRFWNYPGGVISFTPWKQTSN